MNLDEKPADRLNRRRFLTQGGTVLDAAALAACVCEGLTYFKGVAQ